VPRIMIVTGETSGDMHGASLASALKKLRPDVDLIGLGGTKMQAAGVRLIEGIRKLDIVGIPGFSEIRQAALTFRALRHFFQQTHLDAVVFIDNPGLNLRLARVAKKCGHRVVYYIAPQIWAWRANRIHLIKKVTDLVLVILPFEERIYRAADIPCRFIGNPILDTMKAYYDRSEVRELFGISHDTKVIGLFPGSREREVRELLPTMLKAAARCGSNVQGRPLKLLLARAPAIPIALIQEHLDCAAIEVEIIDDGACEVMAASDLLFVKSGTATLQAALIGTPMIILYRLSRLTYWISRFLVLVPWMGLPNLIAGKRIVPELIQYDVRVELLTGEANRLLWDHNARRAMKEALNELRQAVGPSGASERAAERVLCEAEKRNPLSKQCRSVV
jgi:lipid-A-disaccharide synthase